jgi:hypothetical protein
MGKQFDEVPGFLNEFTESRLGAALGEFEQMSATHSF